MLGKLIKYDIQFGARKYVFMAALTAGLILMAGTGKLMGNEIVSGLAILFAVLASIAYVILYVVISVLHLYTQLCGKESYLSYSLPVSPHVLVLSKLICVLIWSVVTVLLLAVFWVVGVDLMFLRPEGTSLWQQIRHSMTDADWESIRGLLPVLSVFAAAALIQQATMFGVCVAMVNIPALKDRNMGILTGVLCYVFGGQTLTWLQLGIYRLYYKVAHPDVTGFQLQSLSEVSGLILYLTVFSALFAAAFYLLTVRMVRRHKSI